jgi:hypothetical protein
VAEERDVKVFKICFCIKCIIDLFFGDRDQLILEKEWHCKSDQDKCDKNDKGDFEDLSKHNLIIYDPDNELKHEFTASLIILLKVAAR